MNEYINIIKEYNLDFLKNCKNYNKINVGFTNLIYEVDDKYIIKICNNKDNENNFKNEIDFYLKNKTNKYIPQLYYYHISKTSNDFSFEIIEKIDGHTLYELWYGFDKIKRTEIIKEITCLMKSFHKIEEKKYDWKSFIVNKLESSFKKCEDLKIFSKKDLKLVDEILRSIGIYLENNDFRLVHSDIHFDNLMLDNKNNLKIIDFETSISAPIDYELDIFLRMCNNPFKYASEETEKYVKLSDYTDIEGIFKDYYPEIFEVHDFKIRHAIYDLEANLRLLPRFPEDNELKLIVLSILDEIKKMLK